MFDSAGVPIHLGAAIPIARVVRIPNRDHLSAVSDPRFQEIVAEFLRESSDSPRGRLGKV